MRATSLGLVSLGLLAVACSSSSGSGPGGSGLPAPSAAELVAFSRATNLIPVNVTVGGATATGYVDTGDPLTLVDPTAYSTASNLTNGGDLASMTLGSETPTNVFAIATADGLTSPDPGVPLSANVGFTAIGAYVATFNYRDVVFGLTGAVPTPPANLQPETVLGFSFEGGETLDGVAIPRSRVVVTVSLEGTNYRMMVDSGASYVTVSQAAYTALTSDGRAQLDGGTAETTSGTSSTTLARAKSMIVGGVEVDSVVVAHDSSFDANLASVSTDAGETIDGSLGGTFLHDFYVTVDYPSQKLHLARYSDVDFAIDPAERIAVGLETQGGSYLVASVSGDAATKGISVGDTVSSIDGTALSGLQTSQAAVLLFGKVGTTKQVTFGQGSTVSVAVEELLPTTPGPTPIGAFHDAMIARNFARRR